VHIAFTQKGLLAIFDSPSLNPKTSIDMPMGTYIMQQGNI